MGLALRTHILNDLSTDQLVEMHSQYQRQLEEASAEEDDLWVKLAYIWMSIDFLQHALEEIESRVKERKGIRPYISQAFEEAKKIYEKKGEGVVVVFLAQPFGFTIPGGWYPASPYEYRNDDYPGVSVYVTEDLDGIDEIDAVFCPESMIEPTLSPSLVKVADLNDVKFFGL